MSEVRDRDVGSDFVSIGTMWLSNKKFLVAIFFSAALYGLWKLRNCLCFQDMMSKNGHCLLQKVTAMIHSWSLLCQRRCKGSLWLSWTG